MNISHTRNSMPTDSANISQPRKRLDLDDACPVTGKLHIPNWKTVTISSDGGETYIDVCCQNCGRSGCLGTSKTLTANITW